MGYKSIDQIEFERASLGALSFSKLIPDALKTGLTKTATAIKEDYQQTVAEQEKIRAQDPVAYDQAMEQRRQLALVRTEAQRIVNEINTAKKMQEDAKGIFVSNKKKNEALHAMGQALSRFSAFVKEHEIKPYYAEVYPIIKPYMNAEAQGKAESLILTQQIKEQQAKLDEGINFKEQLASMGIKPEYLAYGFGGLMMIGLLKKLTKKKSA